MRDFLFGFVKILTFSTDFLKSLQYQNSRKSVQGEPRWCVRTDRGMVGEHTDMTKLPDAFRMYANAREYEHQYHGMPDECS
jgi:hypothetical protein